MATIQEVRETAKQYGIKNLSNRDLFTILCGTNAADKIMAELNEKSLGWLSEQYQHMDITERTKSIILAAMELSNRISKEKIKMSSPDFSRPEWVAAYVMEEMRHLKQEHVRAAYLNSKNRLIDIKELTVGTINACQITPKEVYKMALQVSAASVILIHNHPSGDPAPSPADIDITLCIVDVGKVFDIPLLDHIIIGDGMYTSLQGNGYI